MRYYVQRDSLPILLLLLLETLSNVEWCGCASQILSCGADKTVILWDVCTGSAVRRFRGHASHVLCVRYNEESSFALSGSRDNTVMGWDVRSRSIDPVQVCKMYTLFSKIPLKCVK